MGATIGISSSSVDSACGLSYVGVFINTDKTCEVKQRIAHLWVFNKINCKLSWKKPKKLFVIPRNLVWKAIMWNLIKACVISGYSLRQMSTALFWDIE